MREGVDGVIHRSPDDSNPEVSRFALIRLTARCTRLTLIQTEQGLADQELQNATLLYIYEAVEGIDPRNFGNFTVDEDVSFADWIEQKGLWGYPYVRGLCSQLSTSIVGREPHEIGAHYFFDYLKSGGGIVSLLSDDSDGAQALFIKEGKHGC